MQNVRRWLASIGMSQHADLFAANRIDSAVLPDLTDHDLEKLGLVLGDRRKILRAIRELGESPRSRAVTKSPLNEFRGASAVVGHVHRPCRLDQALRGARS